MTVLTLSAIADKQVNVCDITPVCPSAILRPPNVISTCVLRHTLQYNYFLQDGFHLKADSFRGMLQNPSELRNCHQQLSLLDKFVSYSCGNKLNFFTIENWNCTVVLALPIHSRCRRFDSICSRYDRICHRSGCCRFDETLAFNYL